jgi:hypothetical protein
MIKNWQKRTKTNSIRSTLVRPQIETTGEYEGFFQGSIGVLGGINCEEHNQPFSGTP